MQTEILSTKQTRAVAFEGSTKSLPIAVGGLRDLAVYLPAAFAGSALTFEVELPDGTFAALNSAGSAVTVNCTAAKVNALPASLAAFASIKLVSTDTETLTGTLFGSS